MKVSIGFILTLVFVAVFAGLQYIGLAGACTDTNIIFDMIGLNVVCLFFAATVTGFVSMMFDGI